MKSFSIDLQCFFILFYFFKVHDAMVNYRATASRAIPHALYLCIRAL